MFGRATITLGIGPHSNLQKYTPLQYRVQADACFQHNADDMCWSEFSCFIVMVHRINSSSPPIQFVIQWPTIIRLAVDSDTYF